MDAVRTKPRMTIVDALRGFSLAGIVVVHMVENYAGGPLPEEAIQGANQGILDQIVNVLSLLFIRGKFFALFSFLFGLSFFIQMESAENRGASFSGRFFWRLCLLLGIGYFHHLFYRGDILTIYALAGMLLIPFYRIPTRWILLMVALLLVGLPRFFLFGLGGGDGLLLENAMDTSSPVILDYYQVLKSGSLWEVWQSNAVSGHLMKGEFQVGVVGRAYLTFAFFLLGLVFGRIGYFRNFADMFKPTRRALWISLGVFLAGIVLTGLLFRQLGTEPDLNTWWAMAGLTALDLSNLGMTGIILAGFVLLYRKPRFEKLLARFAPYGRMALTNYILQTLLGTAIFYGWGFGLLGSLPNRYALLIAIGLVLLQILVSKWWLGRFYYGPLEWVWRSLTHMRTYPLKRG